MRRAQKTIMEMIYQSVCPSKHNEWNEQDYKSSDMSKEGQEDRVQLRGRHESIINPI
jgi:hypothetical protein